MNYEVLRDTVAEINLDSIAHNVRIIKEMIGNDVSMMTVIKGDGYGHGASTIAPIMIENGADYLAVATLTEALELRKLYKDYKLFILGYTPNEVLHYVVDNDIVQTIYSIEQAQILDELGKYSSKKPIVHIKYDTGLHRLGYEHKRESIEEIRKILELKNICVEGIFSHLAQASTEDDKEQYEKFIQAISEIESKGYEFKYKHLCESIATIAYPEYRFNMVRPGTVIYGIKPYNKENVFLKQALILKTRICSIRNVRKGEGVGYRYAWKADKDIVIGTLPFGFADGYSRKFSGGLGYMIVNGKKAKVVGRVCMDQCMIDLTDIPNAKIGDEVIIFGDGKNGSITIEQASQLLDVTRGEILSRISRRTPRVYTKNGNICKIVDHLID
ncbi:alanine racemase [Sedimentibacter sp.]|uniref:alanine racemase n=1 Tax=Sedimentibacter sp. TaxID=1960295 RepID=UPI0028AB06C8|nr:alanine racemase [Sedimentibacter sp.]